LAQAALSIKGDGQHHDWQAQRQYADGAARFDPALFPARHVGCGEAALCASHECQGGLRTRRLLCPKPTKVIVARSARPIAGSWPTTRVWMAEAPFYVEPDIDGRPLCQLEARRIAQSGELPEKRNSARELLEPEHGGCSRQHNHDDFADQNCDVGQKSRYAFLFRSSRLRKQPVRLPSPEQFQKAGEENQERGQNGFSTILPSSRGNIR
jgi:hypothetical protein